jgi:hypothetical protein
MKEPLVTIANAPILYKSWSGFPVRKFSFSIAKDVSFCGRYTKLSRFQGLAPIQESSALKFGICIEESIRSHYLLGTDLVEHFVRAWEPFQEVPMKYSKNDKDWASLNATGKKMMVLFEQEKDALPILNPEFNVTLPRHPEQTWYKGTRLEFLADLISHWFDGEILIDIKTAGQSYPEKPETVGYAGLDPQLLTGALVSGIRRVAFLVLVKTREPKIQFHMGEITDANLQEVDEWLIEQYDRLVERRLPMRTGFRFPDNHCTQCAYLQMCLGNEQRAMETLRQKSSSEVEGVIASLDEE